MQAFFEELAQSLEAGETVALTTIVKRRGSVPREIGAKMIVHADGQISGTVGGGCGEAEVWRAALATIETGRPQTVFVDLTEEIAMTSEGICGGTFAVFVQPWSNDPQRAALRQPMAGYARAIAAALQARLGVVLVTVIHATGAWRERIGAQMLIREDGEVMGSLNWDGSPPIPGQDLALMPFNYFLRTPAREAPHPTLTSPSGPLPEAGRGRRWSDAGPDDLLKLDQGQGAQGVQEAEASILAAATEVIATETPRTIRISPAPHGAERGLGSEDYPAPRPFRTGTGVERGPEGEVEIFLDPFLPPPTLVIVGGGHIAVPLAQIAGILGFSVVVTDNRPSFANKTRFPAAAEIIVGDPEAVLREYHVTPRTHFVLVTRAHSHDVQALRAIVDSPAAYIGMIGSQRRIWAVFKLLHDEGYAPDRLARVRAPIGLDLQGSSPAEIALAIMAEIVMLRHGGTGASMSDRLRERFIARLCHLDEQGSIPEFS
jgi:xanthine/CO dehydrogenase XdhC/CoxF family maturation factor